MAVDGLYYCNVKPVVIESKMKNSDLPNLFIIGAPKSGTTSLFRWLADHPQVCASRPKETWFFADKELEHISIRPNRTTHDIDDYLQLFDRVTDQTRIKMEGSTHYLYSQPALEFISGIRPRPKVIVLLRDPTLRIWSHFNYIKQKSQSPLDLSFPKFVDAILDRHQAWDFSSHGLEQHLLGNQLECSNYLKHLTPWLGEIPVDHVRMFTLEELRQNIPNVITDISEWLKIDPAFYAGYKLAPQNAGRSRTALQTKRKLRKYANYLPPTVKSWGGRAIDRIQGVSAKDQSQDDAEAIRRLSRFFAESNKHLENVTGLNLSAWNYFENMSPSPLILVST